MKSSFVSSVLVVLLLGGALAGIVLTDSLITTDDGEVDGTAEGEQESEGSGPTGNADPHAPSGTTDPALILCHYEGKTYSEGAKLGSTEDALECHIRDGVGIWEHDKDPESPNE